jgi:hypothetical protein
VYNVHDTHIKGKLMAKKKIFRMHILLDEALRSMLTQAAHDSWMSVGQYIRETVSLFKGVKYDCAADCVMIGQEIGIEAFENLKQMAERRKMTIQQFCDSLGKSKSAERLDDQDTESAKNSSQLSLFDDQ